MTKTIFLSLISVIFAMSIPAHAAVDPAKAGEHLRNDYTCPTCHTLHNSLSGSSSFNNICLDCHRPGVPKAGNKPFTAADAADPFNRFTSGRPAKLYQTSHRWDGADTVPSAGASAPQSSEMLKTSLTGSLYCVRCHNQHSNVYNNITTPFLRIANNQDQLCNDCHRSRVTTDQSKGTHPVGINYNSAASANPALFNASPLNANPANPTSDLGQKLSGGQIVCSTCHAVHYSDSRSSTIDGSGNFANLSSGDGFLLRTDPRGARVAAGETDKLNICTNCHAGKKSHNNKSQDVQCIDCHGAHVEGVADGTPPNTFLIRRYMNISTQYGTVKNRQVFSQTTPAVFMNPDGTGVCQSCHAVPTGGSYPLEHSLPVAAANDCKLCHNHAGRLGSFSGGCTTCHGFPPTADPLTLATPATNALGTSPANAGAHLTHTSKGMSCFVCHNGQGASGHSDGRIQMGFVINNANWNKFNGDATASFASYSGNSTAAALPTNATANTQIQTAPSTRNSCDVYCHGNWNGSGKTINPSWIGTGQAVCGSCHAASTSSPPAAWPATGSHPRHAGSGVTGGLGLPCAGCHGTIVGNSHLNGSVEWALDATNPLIGALATYRGTASGSTGSVAPSAAFGTCVSVSCHGTGSPTWGGAALTCASCHGGNAAGGTAITTGKHGAHINNAMVLGTNYGCVECHAKTVSSDTTIATPANHANGFKDFSGARAFKTGYAGGNCTSTCHSDGKGTLKSMAADLWTGSTTLGCKGCHGSDAAPAFASLAGEPNYTNTGAGTAMANSHQKHVRSGAAECVNCHSVTTTTGDAILAGAPHTDQAINVVQGNGKSFTWTAGTKSCSAPSCHSAGGATAPDIIWGATLGCTSCHGGNGGSGSAIATGKHGKHIGAAYNFGCGRCHSSTVTTGNDQLITGTTHVNGSKDLAYDSMNPAGTAGTCDNIYCHGTGKTSGSIPLGNWGGATTLTCKGCHGNATSTYGEPDYANSGAGTANANSHSSKHITSAASCANCHEQTTLSGTSIRSNSALHVNGSMDVTIPASLNRGGTAGYIGTKQCANLYCHSDGNGGNPLQTPQWGATMAANCLGCHGGNAASGTAIATGKHRSHMNNYSTLGRGNNLACKECHAKTVSGDSSIITAANHVNGMKDYSGVRAGGSANYGGGSCTATYCHSSGKKGLLPASLEPSPPNWTSGTLDCRGCHGARTTSSAGIAFNSQYGEPNYISGAPGTATANSHYTHTQGAGMTDTTNCANCHYKTVDAAIPGKLKNYSAAAYHLNGVRDLSLKNINGFTGIYDPETKRCANTYCHGNGPSNAWGDNNLGCLACHSANTATASNLQGAHSIHIETTGLLPAKFMNFSGNVSSNNQYRFTCSSCHAGGNNKAAHAAGPANPNGVAEIFYGVTTATRKGSSYNYGDAAIMPADKGFSWSGGGSTSCNTTYCHSNGRQGVGEADGASVTWNSAASAPGGSCGTCHGNAASSTSLSGAHSSHLDNAAVIGVNFGCVDCHAKTVSSDTTISNKSKHVNKLRDYSGVRAGVGYNPETKLCSASYCHSNGKGTPATPPAWASGSNLGCNGCHGTTNSFGYPDYSNGGPAAPDANSHAKHVGSAGSATCGYCHSVTTTTGDAILAGAPHTDQAINVVQGNGKSFTWTAGTKTCSAPSCHSAGGATAPDIIWGATLGCTSCHGSNGGSGSVLATGKHGAHINNAAILGTNYGCVACHAKTVSNDTTIGTSANHMNNFRDFSGARAFKTGYAGGNCASSCHSDGKGNIKSMAANLWTGSTTLDCKGCHGSDAAAAFASLAGEPNYANAGAGVVTANSHQKHVKLGAADCVNCHSATTLTGTAILTGAPHTDTTIDVVQGNGKSFTWTAVTKTCSSPSCHSLGGVTAPNIKWGATPGCISCHGGNAGSGSIITTGKHGAHINNATILGTNYGCIECHAKTVGNDTIIGTPANHMNNFRDFSGARAFKSGYAGGNCTSACHSDGKGNIKSMEGNLWTGSTTLDCKGCHGSDVSPAFASLAGEPNYVNGGVGAVTANSHQKHVKLGAADCANCHSATTTAGTALLAGSPHTDNTIDVVQGNGKSFTWTAGTKTCATPSCHSAGGVIAPNVVWGATLGCVSCHGGNAGSGSVITTGKHGAHINNAATLGTNYGCVECHAKTVGSDTSISTPANHANGFNDFSGVRAYKSGYANGNCASSCHSDGKGNIKSMAANLWTGASTLGCNGCHGSDAAQAFASLAGEPNYANGGAGVVTANSHQKHVKIGAADCVNCHSSTTTTGTAILAGSPHTDNTINVVQGNGKSFTWTAGTKTCASPSCHSAGGVAAPNVVWGATLGCLSCHGGNAGSGSVITTGKHGAHINNAAILGTNYGCVECHAKTVSSDNAIGTPVNHMNNFADFSGVRAFKSGYAGGNCTSSCHSDGKGTLKSMSGNLWTGSTTLDCKGCHGSDASAAFASLAGEPNYTNGGAGAATANSHQKHVKLGAADCVNCHSSTTTTGTALLAGSPHTDNTINVVQGNGKAFTWTAGTKTCSSPSCHSLGGVTASNIQWGSTLGCISCHGGNAGSGSVISTGKHGAHINNSATLGTNYGCVVCHAKTVVNDTTIGTPANHMNNFGDFSGARAFKSGYASGNCTSTCHSDGKGNIKSMAVNLWTGNTTLDCKGCHGSDAAAAFTSLAGEPNYPNAGAGAAAANSHQKHVKLGAADCVNCHSATTLTGTAIVSGSATHTDNIIDLAPGNGKTFTWTAETKTCSSPSCHSLGGVTAPNIQWGANLGCISCHGGNAGSGLVITTGKHGAHINNTATLGTNYGCAVCHAKTVSNDTTIGTPDNHMNNFGDFSGARAFKTGYAGGNCASICHSDGKGVLKSMGGDLWTGSTTLDCKGCHGSDAAPAFASLAGEPNYVNAGAGTVTANSHQKHVKLGAADCVNCHSATTSTGTALLAGSPHTDNVINVVPGNGKSFTWTAGTKTCAAPSCHSAGGVTAPNLQWGAIPTCTSCHGGNSGSGSAIATGKHGAHISNATTIGINYGCVECHAKTVGNDNAVATPTNHANGFSDFSGARAFKTGYNGGNCTSTCHSDGKGTFKSMATDLWTGSTTLDCKGCHGSDAAPAFTSLAGEPNYANTGSGTAKANSHQKHVVLTGAAACRLCHAKTTGNGTSIISGSALHTNQSIDLNISRYQYANMSGIYNSSTKSCAATYCHGAGTPVWGGTTTCNSCHSAKADDAYWAANSAHRIHLQTTAVPTDYSAPAANNSSATEYSFSCASCHSSAKGAQHVSGPVSSEAAAEVFFGFTSQTRKGSYTHGAAQGDEAGFNWTNGSGCNTTYCHSDGAGGNGQPVVWSTTASSTPAKVECAMCHGFTKLSSNPISSKNHLRHVKIFGYTCDNCHFTTTEDGTSIADKSKHLNKQVDLMFLDDSTYVKGTDGSITCSNISCHYFPEDPRIW